MGLLALAFGQGNLQYEYLREPAGWIYHPALAPWLLVGDVGMMCVVMVGGCWHGPSHVCMREAWGWLVTARVVVEPLARVCMREGGGGGRWVGDTAVSHLDGRGQCWWWW